MVKGGKVACSLICKKMTELELYRPEALLFWSAIDEKEFMIYDLSRDSYREYDLQLMVRNSCIQLKKFRNSMKLLQPTAGSGSAAWGIEALSVSHKDTACGWCGLQCVPRKGARIATPR